jgi:hypothetical protein
VVFTVSVRECDVQLHQVREREAGQQPWACREIQFGGQLRFQLRGDMPVGVTGQRAVDRHPVLVGAHATGARGQGDDGALDAVTVAAQPVRPRIQDRDAHRAVSGYVRLQTAALAE